MGTETLRNLFHLIQQLMYCDSSFHGQGGLTSGLTLGNQLLSSH